MEQMNEQVAMPEDALVAFRVGASNFGVDASAVLSIEALVVPGPLPRTPPWIRGLLALRHGAAPLLDLTHFDPFRSLLGAISDEARDGHELPARVVVVETDQMCVGVSCERVFGVVQVPRVVARDTSASAQTCADFIQSEHAQPFGLLLRLNLSKLLLAARLR